MIDNKTWVDWPKSSYIIQPKKKGLTSNSAMMNPWTSLTPRQWIPTVHILTRGEPKRNVLKLNNNKDKKLKNWNKIV